MPLFLCSIIKLTESHGDLFSRHDSPVEVCVFVAVDERGEYVMSDEICRRCNVKQQGRGGGGRSVQLPDSFMILHSSRHLFTYTYVLSIRTTKYIHRKKKNQRPLGGQVSRWTCRTCMLNFGVYLLETAWTSSFGAENMCILRSC